MTSPADLQRGLAHFLQAQSLHKAGRIRDAAAAYRQALALVPGHPGIIDACARLAADTGDWQAAEKLLRRLLDLQPANATGEDRLARCLGHLGRWTEALTHAEKAWSLQPSSGHLFTLLNTLQQLGRRQALDERVPQALAMFATNPAIRAVCASHLLKAGNDLETAFSMLADMRANADPTSRAAPRAAPSTWDGQRFDGVLRVVADAGLGDQLLGASMLPDLQRLGQSTQFISEPRLTPLLQRSFPGIRCISADANGQAMLSDGSHAAADRHITAIELGRYFRRRREDFPSSGGWLRADPVRSQAIRAAYTGQWPGRLLVGISWKSMRQMQDGSGKGIELAALVPLLTRHDCACISLQYGDTRAEMAALAGFPGASLYADPDIDSTGDIDALAAQINALDLVITTSNVTAHIAGGLGKPCWLLLPQASPVLWYWGYDGEHTPWYPSLRIFRNTRDNADWRELVDRVAAQLDQRATATDR